MIIAAKFASVCPCCSARIVPGGSVTEYSKPSDCWTCRHDAE